MRKIKKIKDLHGLKNENRLEIFIDNNDETLSVGFPWNHNIINRIRLDKVNIELLTFIKTLGFEFEYKPKRTLEEILKEYSEKSFEFGKDNYCIADRGTEFRTEHYRTTNFIGAKYYSLEDAEKICEELNS